jgi:hypothetical protein
VASALINTTQQIGGSLGTALLNTIFTSAVAGYITSHQDSLTSPSQLPALQAVATVHSYTVAFWVSAGLIGLAAVIALILVQASRDEVASSDAIPVAA